MKQSASYVGGGDDDLGLRSASHGEEIACASAVDVTSSVFGTDPTLDDAVELNASNYEVSGEIMEQSASVVGGGDDLRHSSASGGEEIACASAVDVTAGHTGVVL